MWILIVYIYAGMMASGDSVALTNVPGFTNQQSCEVAAAQVKKFVKGTAKSIETACVKDR